MFSLKVMPCLLVSAPTVSQRPFQGIFTAIFLGVVVVERLWGIFICFCIFVLFMADFAAPAKHKAEALASVAAGTVLD